MGRPHETGPSAVPWLIVAVLVLVTVAVYWPVKSHPFVLFDDNVYVTENPHVTGGLTPAGIRWAFSTSWHANWHPLTWLSHMVDVSMFGLSAGPHHVVNLVLHLANTLLLFAFLRRSTGADLPSGFVAALFAVHPLHVESVAWIAERKDVLCAFFGLLSLLAYERYVRSPTRTRYALVAVFFILALLAKPMLVTLPFVLLLFDFWPFERWRPIEDFHRAEAGGKRGATIGSLVLEKVPLIVLAGISSIVTVIAQRSGGAIGTFETYPLGERLSVAVTACVAYLQKAVWPFSLAVFYPHPHGTLEAWRVGGAIVLLVAVTVLVVTFARRAPYATVGWFLYLGMLVPVSGLVQVGGQSMADRYTYLPLVGVFLMIVWGATRLAASWRASRALAVIGCAAVAALSIAARKQVDTWSSDVTLFEHALSVTSRNWVAHNNLGLAYDSAGKPDAAIAQYKAALEARPGYPDALKNLGVALAAQGRHAEAAQHFDESMAGQRDPLALFQLAASLSRVGKVEEAIGRYREALQIRPDFPEARNNLANALEATGRTREAKDEFLVALRMHPEDGTAHYNLANLLMSEGALEEAMGHMREAARLRPAMPEAHRGLGRALLKAGRASEAAKEFEEALRLRPGYESARRGLESARAQMANAPSETTD